MEYALKIAKEKGIEGLEQEIKRRGRTVAPCLVPQKEMDEFTLKVKQNATGVVTALSEMVLRDKVGFGTTRMNRFRDYINDLADSTGLYALAGDAHHQRTGCGRRCFDSCAGAVPVRKRLGTAFADRPKSQKADQPQAEN